jgi:hypothetical protein
MHVIFARSCPVSEMSIGAIGMGCAYVGEKTVKWDDYDSSSHVKQKTVTCGLLARRAKKFVFTSSLRRPLRLA